MDNSFILLDMLRLFFQRSSPENKADSCDWGKAHGLPATLYLPGTRTWVGILLLSALWQLNANLIHLMGSDTTESVHQARVGLRRFRSTYRLFKLIAKLKPLPLNDDLSALFFFLCELRDIDVARLEVLPRLRRSHTSMPKDLLVSLNVCIDELGVVAKQYRYAIRCILNDTSFSESMWQLTLWLVSIFNSRGAVNGSLKGIIDFSIWAEHRVNVMHQKFLSLQSKGHTGHQNHRTRICAKRLRYAIEDLECFLHPRTKQWWTKASESQSRLGLEHDIVMTVLLVEKFGHSNLATFIRRNHQNLN